MSLIPNNNIFEQAVYLQRNKSKKRSIAYILAQLSCTGYNAKAYYIRSIKNIIYALNSKKFERNYKEWKPWQFNYVPRSENYCNNLEEYDSIVIVPMSYTHDSGYSCMEFVCIKDDKPVKRISGCSDVVHIEGIGGYGLRSKRDLNTFFTVVSGNKRPENSWSIDVLPGSKYVRIFSTTPIIVGDSLSSFEIFSKERPTKKYHPKVITSVIGITKR